MANYFDLLAKAKPATLSRLLSRMPLEDAAIVLTRLPDALAFQVIAYFPDAMQGELGPMMVEARWESEERVAETSSRVGALLAEAKKKRAATQGSEEEAEQPRSAPVPDNGPGAYSAPATMAKETAAAANAMPKRPVRASSTPVARPGGGASRARANPYQPTPDSAIVPPVSPANVPAGGEKGTKPGLAARIRQGIKSTLAANTGAGTDMAKMADDQPRPWTPRAATTSPINGPALPGKPAVSGDPLASPLARAGLMDLIGRAQQTRMPRGTVRGTASPSRTPNAKGTPDGRPEPREGVLARSAVRMVKTPKTIGPRGGTAPLPPPEESPTEGARRMDGKAILAAILREAGPGVRETVREDDPGLFRQLRERMFYFDDLIFTEDNGLARVFTAAPARESALALKFAAPTLRDRVLRAVSPGRARALLEGATGRAGVDDIEQAQKKVLDVALQLQAAGRILIDPRDPDLAG